MEYCLATCIIAEWRMYQPTMVLTWFVCYPSIQKAWSSLVINITYNKYYASIIQGKKNAVNTVNGNYRYF